MNRFSDKSAGRLATCHKHLQDIFNEVIKVYDITILEGHRSLERQTELFESGASRVRVGKHNQVPSKAVDAAPYPIDWEDTKRFTYLAGLVMGIAHERNIKVRWGGNWDSDNEIIIDQNFNDLVHYEIV